MRKVVKIFGKSIPIWLLALIILAGIAVAAVVVVTATITLRQPTHEVVTVDFGAIPGGYEATKTVEAKLALPATYDVIYTLEDDLDKFTAIVVKITAKDSAGNTLGTPIILTKANTSGTYEDIPAEVSKVVFEFKVTPELKLETGTEMYEESLTLKITADVETA